MNEQDRLEQEILRHDRLYWVENSPEISDPEYDELCRQLKETDPTSPVLHQVHRAVLPKGKTVTREKPMLSLDKAYTAEEVLKWMKSVARSASEEFRLSPKYDGVASEIDEAVLSTAGDDGFTGEDITDKLPIVDLSRQTMVQERGELVVMKSTNTSLRRGNGESYANERAAAVGLINADDTDRTLGRVIQFMPHSATLSEFILGSSVAANPEFLDDFLTRHSKAVQAADYPADGLVIALVDEEYGESLGETAHHPRHSIAFKFKNPSAQTKVIDIIWQCGKHKLTPVAVLNPVTISGCVHEKASLHNWEHINRLGLTVGSEVEIERCGDVIPQVKRIVAKATGNAKLAMPSECPGCGSLVEGHGVDIRCTNLHCGGAAAKKLLDALNRIGVENIGPQIASDLVHFGIRTLPAVFAMDATSWQVQPGFAKNSAAKMAKQFQMFTVLLKPIEDYRIVAAMNIPGVGLTLAKRLCAVMNVASATEAELAVQDGIGSTRAKLIAEGFDHNLWSWAITGLNVVITKGLADKPLICFTGKSDTPRAEWIKKAEAKGYAFKNAVTKALAVLVCNDLESQSSKMKKARKYGTKIMTYEEFEND